MAERRIWPERKQGGDGISPRLRSEAGFWGARRSGGTAMWSREICEAVRAVGSTTPKVFRTPEQINGVIDAVKVDLLRLDNELDALSHRILDERGTGKVIEVAVLLTPQGEALLKQLQGTAA